MRRDPDDAEKWRRMFEFPADLTFKEWAWAMGFSLFYFGIVLLAIFNGSKQ